MTNHTPTTERIRDLYSWAYAWRIADDTDAGETDLSGMRDEQRVEFDRWLAAHDREVRDAALKEAEETVSALLVDPAFLADPTIYASAATDALTSAQTALHALRSDREGEQP